MCEIFEQISKIGIVPVIKIDDAEKALPLADALIKGGLPVAEVTFRKMCIRDSHEGNAGQIPPRRAY